MYDIHGKSLFHWKAYDSHPHERGDLWGVIFYGVVGMFLLGLIGFGFYIGDGWGGILPVITLLTVFGFYLYMNREGHQLHQVDLTTRGILIDSKDFFEWSSVERYWFVYETNISVINFERKGKKPKISLQMGDMNPDDFREIMNRFDTIEEDETKTESGLDVWIRTLKL